MLQLEWFAHRQSLLKFDFYKYANEPINSPTTESDEGIQRWQLDSMMIPNIFDVPKFFKYYLSPTKKPTSKRLVVDIDF